MDDRNRRSPRDAPRPSPRSRLAGRAGALLLLAAFGTVAGGAALLLPRAAGERRPNLVLVVWDTCRGDRLSLHGYRRPTTPLLAAWSAGGTVFRSCYSPSPWTPPAHASLFTGLLPRNHGLREVNGVRSYQPMNPVPEHEEERPCTRASRISTAT